MCSDSYLAQNSVRGQQAHVSRELTAIIGETENRFVATHRIDEGPHQIGEVPDEITHNDLFAVGPTHLFAYLSRNRGRGDYLGAFDNLGSGAIEVPNAVTDYFSPPVKNLHTLRVGFTVHVLSFIR
jgi:hypothetical protein